MNFYPKYVILSGYSDKLIVAIDPKLGTDYPSPKINAPANKRLSSFSDLQDINKMHKSHG